MEQFIVFFLILFVFFALYFFFRGRAIRKKEKENLSRLPTYSNSAPIEEKLEIESMRRRAREHSRGIY